MKYQNPSYITSKEQKNLLDILQNDIDLAVWERSVDEEINLWLLKLLSTDFKKIEFSAGMDCLDNTLKTYLGMYESLYDSGFQRFKSDINALCRVFTELTGCEEFKLSFALIKDSMCRRFHVDVNRVRLLCTYLGPGTQWISPEYLHDELMYHPGNSMVQQECQIQQCKAFDVVVLKGSLYPEKAGMSILHRSPPLTSKDDLRLLLRLDYTHKK